MPDEIFSRSSSAASASGSRPRFSRSLTESYVVKNHGISSSSESSSADEAGSDCEDENYFVNPPRLYEPRNQPSNRVLSGSFLSPAVDTASPGRRKKHKGSLGITAPSVDSLTTTANKSLGALPNFNLRSPRPSLSRLNSRHSLSRPVAKANSRSISNITDLNLNSADRQGSTPTYRHLDLPPLLHKSKTTASSGLATTPENTTAFSRRHNPHVTYGSLDHTGGQSYGLETSQDKISENDFIDLHNKGGDTRRFYDDFTTIDWIRDTINDSTRRTFIHSQPGIRGKLNMWFDACQGWILITIIAFSFAVLAFAINQFETLLFDLKQGICRPRPFARYSMCCDVSEDVGGTEQCEDWLSWGDIFGVGGKKIDFAVYFVFTITLAMLSCVLTLRTKNTSYVSPLPSAEPPVVISSGKGSKTTEESMLLPHNSDTPVASEKASSASHVIYSAYGSGVPEVKTILSGFVIRRFLGTSTLFYKSIALVLSIASGMSVGKEGPFVHLATCVGNISCRLFPKYAQNDLKRRQILSAASSAGVALAFGSPLGGVLFSLEEVSYYFLPHQLFRIFFCAMISALFLKFLDPYKTGKIVLFTVDYNHDWHAWELINFIFLGVCGGLFGASFCKFTMYWGNVRKKYINNHPKLEVFLIAVITACLTIGNEYTRSSISELLLSLTSPCPGKDSEQIDSNLLCPMLKTDLSVIGPLVYALVVKVFLTAITFGIKVPAGIYVPLMVIGALFGRLTGIMVQYLAATTELFKLGGHFNYMLRTSIDIPGTYAMAGAGAFMAGVTRMNVTLAVILFELTGSLDYVLPFSVAILISNWVANAIEPRSLYELLIEKNNFPYLDNRLKISFDNSTLADLVTTVDNRDILPSSGKVSVARLMDILARLHGRGELDGCVPFVTPAGVLVGLISAPELEFALDKIKEQLPVADSVEVEESILIETLVDVTPGGSDGGGRPKGNPVFDLSPYIDRAPLALDLNSPLALVQMVFIKLGSRVICVTGEGRFMGLLHKKKFIDFCHKWSKAHPK
ncbi:similar to Saccharomyces cerevisiae YJR040W GEF1 Voltage-gated chloride channel localized to the golgi [Geotrichum candidum]|uniref:Similar to Saccharomyces cerevisiae YJR040W GEF1 Voltage-gated chloride channel localized to the golgi n=1 Tax=Geotrichum candidum TaxID=1173061 RepID=A0A0J9X5L9_GEOCN|nr:similar to Saccharomyces cerevisiae YJR040W GEF1 Voltage-gated chloride channel localized to the golgi [Geotrichum candidum]